MTAKCAGKTAVAAVEVVSTKIQKEHTPAGGLFKEIKYEERPDVPIRARFDRKDGIIWINTLGPSVDLYFGQQGTGQEQPANQVFVAELVTELAAAGHEIAVHGYEHRNLLLRGPRATYDDIARARDVIEAFAGTPVRFFRPPYGVLSGAAVASAQSLGLRPVLWTCRLARGHIDLQD